MSLYAFLMAAACVLAPIAIVLFAWAFLPRKGAGK